MPLYSFEGTAPRVHPTAFVAPTATLVGDVVIEEGASVWYGAVIRADFSPVIVRARRQRAGRGRCSTDRRTSPPRSARAPRWRTCASSTARILGEECLIANGTTVLDGARIGARSLIAARLARGRRREIPAGVLAAGSPAQVKRAIEGTPAERWVTMNPPIYAELAHRHRNGIELIG